MIGHRWSEMTFEEVFDVVLEGIRDLEASVRRDRLVGRPRRGAGLRALAEAAAPIVQIPAWMIAGEPSPEAYLAALYRDRNPPPVRLPRGLRIAAATFELLAVGEIWPRMTAVDRAEVAAACRAGWRTIEWGGRTMAPIMCDGVIMYRDLPDGVAVDPPRGLERRAPQGAKRRRAW